MSDNSVAVGEDKSGDTFCASEEGTKSPKTILEREGETIMHNEEDLLLDPKTSETCESQLINTTNHNDSPPSECKDQTEEKVAEVSKPENQLDLGGHTKTPKDLVSPEDIDCNESADDEVSEEDSLVNLLLGSASNLEERLAALQLLTSNTMDEFNESSNLLDTIEKVGKWDREDVQDLLEEENRVTQQEETSSGEGTRRCGEMLRRYRQSQELGVILEVDSQDNSELS